MPFSFFRFVLLVGWLFSFTAYSQLQLTAVTNTPSTCPNNGSITVSATTTAPPLFYSIIAGPVLQPTQTSNVFASLPPGTYTVRVTDGASAVQTQITTITGNYSTVDFNPAETAPYCDGASDGSLTGNIVPGTGLAPFSWQLIAPSPVIVAPQSSNTFTNLAAGNYTMRVTDACNNLRTIVVTLEDPHTDFVMITPPSAEKTGCDTMTVRFGFQVDAYRPPFTFTYQTSNGPFTPVSGTIIDSSLLHINGWLWIEQPIPGLTYGDWVQATVTNACGNPITTAVTETYPFVFYPSFIFGLCGDQVAGINLENVPMMYGEYHTYLNHPVMYSLTETTTNTVVASGTAPVSTNTSGVTIQQTLAAGGTYHFVLTDACGEVFEDDYTIPSQAPPQLDGGEVASAACIDSVVGTYRIHVLNFGTNPQLVLLTGPATLGSTSPEFGYTGTYSYPDTVPDNSAGYFFLSNLGVGTYTYKVIDDCGNELPGTFTITPEMVTALHRTSSYERGCPGENKLYYSISAGVVTVTSVATNTVIDERTFPGYGGIYNNDSILNLPAGAYAIEYAFAMDNAGTYINDGTIPCEVVIDTVIIPPYEFPDLFTNNTLMCNGAVYIELVPDTSKGVAPYQYEIISGPQTFPLQNSNVFEVATAGTYIVRIFDDCGNAAAREITVEALTFPPPEASSGCNDAHIFFPPSDYAFYLWTAPDGSTFIADSLVLEPVTPADTGVYTISRIISINGCNDTVTLEQHVGMPHFLSQTLTFCPGTEITVGTHVYDTPGTYYDTLPGTQGCDSIVVTTLELSTAEADTLIVLLCQGDSLEIGGTFYDLPGFYADSVQNSTGCYDYTVTDLRFNGGAFTVAETICAGDSAAIGNHYYTFSGTYTDTLATAAGCDSIITLQLTVLPILYDSLSAAICYGETYTLNGQSYTQAGTYTQLFPGSTGCDSTVTLVLTVHPLPEIAAFTDQYDVEPGTTIHLNAQTSDQPLAWQWSGNAVFATPILQQTDAVVNGSGWITVTGTDANGCVATDNIYITAELTSTLYVPNAFTPDGSGTNDFFHVSYTNITDFSILVFDRWGEVIFESTDVNFRWNATYKGATVQDGIYTYKLFARGIDLQVYDVVGHITVVR